MKLPAWSLFRRSASSKVTFGPARLVRTDIPSTGSLRIRSPLCRIGRALDNDICFENDTVSGHHNEIYHLPDGTFQICDLRSTNGTWVNGRQVRTKILKDGDVLELGEVRLHFRIDDKT